MTPTNITKRQLLYWDSEINKLQGSVLALFLGGRIRDFRKENDARIQTVKDGVNKLQTKYFVIENEQIKHEGEGKDAKPVTLEGKSYEDYKTEFDHLMQEVISIKI